MIRFCRCVLALSACLGSILLTACGTLQVGLERNSTPDIRLQNTVVAMETANARLATLVARPTHTHDPSSSASPTPSITPTQPEATGEAFTLTPTTTSTPGPPKFSSLFFSTQPDGPPQRFFVEDIQRVYAVWNYENMKVGMVVHRLWEKDGELWSERYETWDMDKFGSNGTRRDIHIFDLDYGLEEGKYTLTLAIDGVVQEFQQGDRTNRNVEFQVVKSDIEGPIPSPNKMYSIFIVWGGRISIEDPDGNFRDILVTNEIASVAWFPDNRHIIYVDRDRTGQESLDSDLGITHQMWTLDVTSGERHLIGSNEENYHHPVISPDGRHAAVLSGNAFQDACQASPHLIILEFDDNFQTKEAYPLSRFSGWPSGGSIDTGITPNNSIRAGYWEDENIFIASVRWICPENSSQVDGLYLLNMENLQVEHLRE